MSFTSRWRNWSLRSQRTPAPRSGAVIVGPGNEVRSIGYNGFPRGVDDNIPERHERPLKYSLVVHAEQNAILNAARANIPISEHCRLYMNFEPCPCAECTKAIIQSGIRWIIGPNVLFPGKGPQWEESIRVSKMMLDEAGVVRETVDVY